MQQQSLHRLAEGFPGISARFGMFLAEAAAVCLHTAGHKPGVEWTINGAFTAAMTLTWDMDMTDQVLKTWKDRDEATEYGATGIALLALLVAEEYTVVERSVKGTGFDYWLGSVGEEEDAPPTARLEISGIRKGDQPKILKRVYKKLKQVHKSDYLQLPAIIVVTEFQHLITYYVKA